MGQRKDSGIWSDGRHKKKQEDMLGDVQVGSVEVRI
jgi:hypothetical protein